MKKITTLAFASLISLTFLHAQTDWHITGNAGTTPGANFLGTTDAKALMFKVNSQRSGYLDFDALKANTSFGYQALLNVSASRVGNAAFGYQSLFTNSTGAFNTAAGQSSMYFNTSGSSNVASGARTLYTNTTGSFNTAVGNRALYLNTKASNNTAIGNRALYNNSVGYSNVAIGVDALNQNTVGHNLVAVGDSALYNQSVNPSGYENVAVGSKALFSNTTGDLNTAIGTVALYKNKTGVTNSAFGAYGLYANISGYQNTSVGYYSLHDNNYGNSNTAVGVRANFYNQDGDENTAMGTYALEWNEGSYNTAVGYSAGSELPHNYRSTFVGYQADAYIFLDGVSNSMALGYQSTVTADNQVRIGNSSVTSIGGYTNWSNISDGRVKKNIKENVPGLIFINKLKPVTYNLDLNASEKIIQPGGKKDRDRKVEAPSQSDITARNAKQQIVYTGFVAQEVEKAANELDYDFSGVDAAKSDKDLYGLRYAEFVVPLVKAVQELSKKNDEKDTKIQTLEKRLEKLEAVMNGQSLAATAKTQTVCLNGATLEQNIPNPFSQTTTINYTLPRQYSSAKIIVTDKSGKSLKEVNVSGSGKGSVHVDASSLAAGAYQYSLYVNNKLIDTKQMILNK